MKGSPSCSAMSWTVQMWGWVRGRGRARLPLETLAGRLVVEVPRWKKLQGDVAPETGVLRLVDDNHSALAQLGDDAVMGHRLADHGAVRRQRTTVQARTKVRTGRDDSGMRLRTPVPVAQELVSAGE